MNCENKKMEFDKSPLLNSPRDFRRCMKLLRRRPRFLLSPPCFLALLLLLPGSLAVAAREAEYQVRTNKDVLVAMRDGVRLATDLYLPARNGAAVPEKFPIILMRTPYSKAGGQSFGQF